jgi:hypothetical protein
MRRRRRDESRYAQDNRIAPNPWAFVTVGLAGGAIVGLALLLWLL